MPPSPSPFPGSLGWITGFAPVVQLAAAPVTVALLPHAVWQYMAGVSRYELE